MVKLEQFYTTKQHAKYFSTVRSEIVPLIPASADRVLDLGCGSGSTLRMLKERGLARWTCGVDINATALEQARDAGVDLAIQGSLDDLSLPIDPASLDIVLCLDILEHLVDPWSVVAQVVPLLKPGGALIASIPNVQSVRVITSLLVGRWDYRDCGILDRGHLRFFTRRTAIALLDHNPLRVDRELPLLEPHWLPRVVNHLTLHLLQRWITVQFLLRAIRV